MYDYRSEVIAEANAALLRERLPTYSELAKALRDLMPVFEGYPRGTLVDDAKALLARIPS